MRKSSSSSDNKCQFASTRVSLLIDKTESALRRTLTVAKNGGKVRASSFWAKQLSFSSFVVVFLAA